MIHKNNILQILAVIVIGTLIGCNDFLEVKPDGNFTEEQVWSDPDYAEGVLMNAYSNIPTFYTNFSGGFLDCATDNAVTNSYSSGLVKMATGGWSLGANPIDNWNTAYTQIRYINQFIENGLDVEYLDYDEIRNEKKVKRLKGEAFFMRAWYQWELLRRFAGLSSSGEALGFPVVTTVIDLDKVPNIARSTYEECVEQIKADCDTAIKYLPPSYTGNDQELGINNIGRATSVAASSLKSRVYLYAASPLFSSSDMLTENWVRAAQNGKNAIDEVGALPSLDASYYNNPNSSELVMRRFTNGKSPEIANFAPSMYGNGRTNPSQQLVDAFPMLNGYPINHGSAEYDESFPYSNRDPRFYNTVLFHWAKFANDSIVVSEGGKDSESVSVDKASRTGYYLRKWLSESVKLTPGESSSDKHYFSLFRKVEMYLNYAEAANEAWTPNTDPLGLGLTAEDAIRAVRKRAGISQPDIYLDEVVASGKDAFRTLVQNERRIELCFENHRFFDVRRWKLPLEQLNTTVQGVDVETLEDESYILNRKDVEKRTFAEHMYYGPLPLSEIIKSDVLEQNMGW